MFLCRMVQLLGTNRLLLFFIKDVSIGCVSPSVVLLPYYSKQQGTSV